MWPDLQSSPQFFFCSGGLFFYWSVQSVEMFPACVDLVCGFWLIFFWICNLTKLTLPICSFSFVMVLPFVTFNSHGRNQRCGSQLTMEHNLIESKPPLYQLHPYFLLVLRWIPGSTRKKCYREIYNGGLCLVNGTTFNLDDLWWYPFSRFPYR